MKTALMITLAVASLAANAETINFNNAKAGEAHAATKTRKGEPKPS